MQEKKDIEKLLKAGVPVGFMPQGISMHPTIEPGRDSVIVEPIADRKLKRGDVALFRRSYDAPRYAGMLVLHRVCRVKKEGIYFVGDNEVQVEGPILPNQVMGIMTELIRKNRHISVKSLRYRFLTGAWLAVRPFRFAITKPLKLFRRGEK